MSFTHISFLFLLLLKFSPLTLIGQDQSVIDQFNRDLRNAQNDKQRLDAHLGLADEYLFCLPDSVKKTLCLNVYQLTQLCSKVSTYCGNYSIEKYNKHDTLSLNAEGTLN